jgi:hypothetical protein
VRSKRLKTRLLRFLSIPHWNDRIASNKNEVIHALQLVALGGDAPDDDEPEVRKVRKAA